MKIFHSNLIGFLVLVMTLAVAGFAQEPDTNQEDQTSTVKRFEIGGQFTFLNRRDRDLVREAFHEQGFGTGRSNPFAVKEFGVGARFGYNLTRAIAIEAEANVFPTDKTIQLAGNGPAIEVNDSEYLVRHVRGLLKWTVFKL